MTGPQSEAAPKVVGRRSSVGARGIRFRNRGAVHRPEENMRSSPVRETLRLHMRHKSKTASINRIPHNKITTGIIHFSFGLWLALEANSAEGEGTERASVVVAVEASAGDRVAPPLLAADVSNSPVADRVGMEAVVPTAALE